MNPRVRLVHFASLVCAGAMLAGCTASDRQRPIQTSRIPDSGVTLQSVRKQFEGKWMLEQLEYSSPQGQSAVIEGTTGVLTADGFGNLAIEYRMSEAGLKMLGGMGFTPPNPVISTQGEAAINVDQKSVAYVDATKKPFDASVAAGRANPFALERTRYYDFGPDGTLTLSTRHDDGKTAVVSKWKKG